MKKALRKILKGLLYIIGGAVVIIAGLILIVWIKSPGKTEPILDLNGEIIENSISTIETVELGGQEQYIITRGRDVSKPVMLFIHGGPGSAETAFMKDMNQGIEEDYIMVYWEQRGAGKSYSKEIAPETMNLGQFVSDAAELSEILTRRFGQDKIYIMGHSWGSLVGILAAESRPELYHAYIGIGQVCHQYRGEQVSFDWIKDEAFARNDIKAQQVISMLQMPDSTGSSSEWLDFLGRERAFVNRYGGGISHEVKGGSAMIKPLLWAPEYTFREKMSYMKACNESMIYLWEDVLNRNLFNEIDSMQVPVYIFQGEFDYQTPTLVAKEYFDQLKAPEKSYFLFENSAHSPLMEEPERFNAILREKLGE